MFDECIEQHGVSDDRDGNDGVWQFVEELRRHLWRPDGDCTAETSKHHGEQRNNPYHLKPGLNRHQHWICLLYGMGARKFSMLSAIWIQRIRITPSSPRRARTRARITTTTAPSIYVLISAAICRSSHSIFTALPYQSRLNIKHHSFYIIFSHQNQQKQICGLGNPSLLFEFASGE